MNKTMKYWIFRGVLPSLIILSLFGCEDKIVDKYLVNEPVYLSYEDLRGPVKTEDVEEIANPGKIYFKENYIFVNEVSKGVHVIDNSNPSLPQFVTFINIPGNVDLAIKDNILYADSYVDLVALDISDLSDIKEVNRVENAFPYTLPLCENGYEIDQIEESKGVVTGWRLSEKEKEVNSDRVYPYYTWYQGGALIDSDMAYRNSTTTMEGGKSVGTGGSLARFIIFDNTLYTIDGSQLKVYDITSTANPLASGDTYIRWDIETLFLHDAKLFIGSQTGMLIYSLENPLNPSFISEFSHVTSCDPVVVEGDYAYVTLRAGSACGGFSNQMDVIDISTITTPELVKSYPLTEPYGLGINNNVLFVCDGSAGLKIYDASDPLNIQENLLAEFTDINTYDVIPMDDILIMISSDGLYQYDYSDLEDIKLLSVIQISGNN